MAEYLSSAFTVAELRVMLQGYSSRVEVQSNGRYLTLEKGLPGAFFYATDTEAQSLGNLLIFLVETNLISLQEITNRLIP
jgi:hypothetical protein